VVRVRGKLGEERKYDGGSETDLLGRTVGSAAAGVVRQLTPTPLLPCSFKKSLIYKKQYCQSDS
jgi:hypothetical protein